MDGVFRAVRWVMRGFDAADSERTVRPESPTSPNVEIGPTAKNLCTQCSREDCEQGIISSDELDFEEMLKATCISCYTWTASCQWHPLACSEASSANDNNSWCSLSSCTRSLPWSARWWHHLWLTLHWLDFQGRRRRRAPASTRPSTGVRTPSTKWNREVDHQAMPQIRQIFQRVRNSKSRHVSHFGESVICDWHTPNIHSVFGVETWHWTRAVLDPECAVVGDVGVWSAFVVEIVIWAPS